MGAGRVHQAAAAPEPDAEARVAAAMAQHGRALLRVANQWSLCHDDALDAYQRALEIYLRRIDTVDPATEGAWLRVVVKHEAMAIRRARSGSVASDDVDLDAHIAAADRSTEEVVASGERVRRSAEALRALKPDEARALLLKAEGLSYHEIGERCGWTYTKTNRAITEGRRRFLQAYAAIESGEECERLAPLLAALARGTASAAEMVEIRPHLRHCSACRATVRELHLSGLRRVKLLLPGLLLAPLRWLHNQAPGADSLQGHTPEELLRHAPRIRVPESALHQPPVSTDLGPSPATTDLPAQVTSHLDQELEERLERVRRLRLGRIKDHLSELAGRANSSDVATGLHALTFTGGGRIGAVAATIGLCLSGIGAGALCVATGVVKTPAWIFHERSARPHHRHIARAPARPKPRDSTPAEPRDYSQAHLPATLRFAEATTPTTAPPHRHRTPERRALTRKALAPRQRQPATTQDAEFGPEGLVRPRTQTSPASLYPPAGSPSQQPSSRPSSTMQTNKEFGP